jgi:hypothetical protein
LRIIQIAPKTAKAKPYYFDRSARVVKVGDVFSSGSGFYSVSPDYVKRLPAPPNSHP